LQCQQLLARIVVYLNFLKSMGQFILLVILLVILVILITLAPSMGTNSGYNAWLSHAPPISSFNWVPG
jgi:hypothetical protein